MTPKKTLGEFIIDNQNQFEYSTGELSRLLNAIRLASKAVNHEVNKAGLVDIIGATDQVNHSDETQQKLDVFANHAFKRALINRDIVCGFASEEEENFISISSTNGNNNNNYVVLVDPLDGSSNIDTNVSVGTIFSIYRRLSSNTMLFRSQIFCKKEYNKLQQDMCFMVLPQCLFILLVMVLMDLHLTQHLAHFIFHIQI
jgi:fructose-1,6-bisphosphatase